MSELKTIFIPFKGLVCKTTTNEAGLKRFYINKTEVSFFESKAEDGRINLEIISEKDQIICPIHDHLGLVCFCLDTDGGN